MAYTIQGLKEAGYSPNDFKTTTGEFRIPVSEESLTEIPVYSYGDVVLSDQDLAEEANKLMAETGNQDWTKGSVGLAEGKKEADIGKKLWMRVPGGKWVGPILVTAVSPRTEASDMEMRGVPVKVSEEVGKQFGIHQKGGMRK